MTALLSLVATLFIAISVIRFIFSEETSDLQVVAATGVACLLIWLINLSYQAGQP